MILDGKNAFLEIVPFKWGVLEGLVQLDKIEASKCEFPVHWLHVMYEMSIMLPVNFVTAVQVTELTN